MESSGNAATSRRARPCDACRKRKRRCVTEPGAPACQLCRANGLSKCTVNEPDGQHEPLHRKRAASDQLVQSHERHRSAVADASSRTIDVIEDYDDLRGPSLLKENLGLQQHRYLRHVGPHDELDTRLFEFCSFDERDESRLPDGASVRKVSADTQFILTPYSRTLDREEEFEYLDAVERLVAPNGPHLIKVYFDCIHPSFPIIDKKTFLEKYERTYREFSPPCLAGVYLAASDWWHHDRFLSSRPKPDVRALERIARQSFQSVLCRPKLSTLQGGLLLLHCRPNGGGVWATTCQIIAVAQELGVHLDCSSWRIPLWERSLRHRLGSAVFALDKWMALAQGRPSHISDEEWVLPGLQNGNSVNEAENEIQLDHATSVFWRFVSLAAVTSKILKLLRSPKTSQSPRDAALLLETAKPIQIDLKTWYHELSTSTQQRNPDASQLGSPPSIHLAYYAAETALHRVIQGALTSHPCDPLVYRVCRNAALERATKAVALVRGLGIADLYSFWYFPSSAAFVSIGTSTAFLYITSRSLEEAKECKKMLDEYRWSLRTMSRCLSHIEYAVKHLDASLWHLEDITPEHIASRPSLASSASGETSQQHGGDDRVPPGHSQGRGDQNIASQLDSSGARRTDESAESAILGANLIPEQAPPDYRSNWVEMELPSIDSIGGEAANGVTMHYDIIDTSWQYADLDFFGRDWQPPSETSEYWALNRSLEDF